MIRKNNCNMGRIRLGLWLPFLLIVGWAWTTTSCNKDDDNGGDLPLVFESLKAEHDTIPLGGTCKITATASGGGLVYNWSVTAGTVLGSGKEVTYTTDPCEPGEHTITCRVEDNRGASETKTVKVFVLSE
jgi:hypothetical protein